MRLAAKQAFWLGTYEQALIYSKDALGLLGSLKEGPERTEHEIELQRILCNTLAVTKGFESKEAGAAFRRTARTLARDRQQPCADGYALGDQNLSFRQK